MRYAWRSPVGWWTIYPKDERWMLAMEGLGNIGSYRKAFQAADDVYMQATGWHPWDSISPKPDDTPPDLSEWQRTEDAK
jgi:hypothetical protein